VSVRPYASLARTAARSVLAYPLNFLLGLLAVLFQLVTMLSIWGALLRSGASIAGFDWAEMKGYLLVVYATGALLSFTDFGLAHRIRDGMVAVDLTRPVDFQRARFAEAAGVATVEITFSALVCAAVIASTGGAALPPPDRAILFAASLLLVVPLKFCLSYLTAMTCFWTQNASGVSLVRSAITHLFSGALIPLMLLPGWLQGIASVLPFASITFTPAMVFIGRASGGAALWLIGVQCFWVAVLWCGSRLVWRTAVRQLTVHGG
jgi:ABC-2 type transport system permease protein